MVADEPNIKSPDEEPGNTARWQQRGVRRKRLVHGIANCQNCDWTCEDYLTVQRAAAEHSRVNAHYVTMELGYHVDIYA